MRGHDLHTTQLGDTGSLIVLCHGLFGQGKNWTAIAKGLADRHRVLMADMPNHGRSAWTERIDYLDMADDLADLLRAHGAEAQPVTLVGHSMGGKAAMIAALRHRELVERLCVVDMSPVAYAGASREFAGYVAGMRAIDLAALSRRGEADEALVEAVPNPVVRGFLLQNLRNERDGWRWQPNLELLARDLDVLGDWPEERLVGLEPYPGPVLWVAGAESSYVLPDYYPAMDRWFPLNRRVTVKAAGHWVHSEQPVIFTEVLRRFVDG